MKRDEAIRIFQAQGGLLRTTEAIGLGIHQRTLYQLRDSGALEAISRGIYRLTSLPPLANPDLVTVALRVPRAVVCLISALAHYEVTDEIPHEVQIALPRGTKKPRLDYPPIRVHQFTGAALTAGVEHVRLDGVQVQIYSLAKTVADCFRFRNSLGTGVAVQALGQAIRRKGVSPAEILKFSRLCHIETVILPYIEGVS